MKYLVRICETITKDFTIDALSKTEAIFQAKEKYLINKEGRKTQSINGIILNEGLNSGSSKIIPSDDDAMLKNDEYEKDIIGDFEEER